MDGNPIVVGATLAESGAPSRSRRRFGYFWLAGNGTRKMLPVCAGKGALSSALIPLCFTCWTAITFERCISSGPMRFNPGGLIVAAVFYGFLGYAFEHGVDYGLMAAVVVAALNVAVWLSLASLPNRLW